MVVDGNGFGGIEGGEVVCLLLYDLAFNSELAGLDVPKMGGAVALGEVSFKDGVVHERNNQVLSEEHGSLFEVKEGASMEVLQTKSY